jgi:putative pyruvate formate lyase activating enzyme
MPGGLEETRAILDWIATLLGPNTYVNLMEQYSPSGKVDAEHYPEIDRRLSSTEFEEARTIARDVGLTRLDKRRTYIRLANRSVAW